MRLHPGAAPPLLGVDAAALRDGSVAIDAVWGDEGKRLAERARRARRTERGVLLSALAARAPARLRPTRSCAPRSRGWTTRGSTCGALACELAVSERQLRRRFESAVGYGPKRLARVLRLTRALAAAHAGEELGRVAVDAGYADQAHFATTAAASRAWRRRRCSPDASTDRERPFSTRHARRRAAMMRA